MKLQFRDKIFVCVNEKEKYRTLSSFPHFQVFLSTALLYLSIVLSTSWMSVEFAIQGCDACSMEISRQIYVALDNKSEISLRITTEDSLICTIFYAKLSFLLSYAKPAFLSVSTTLQHPSDLR